MCINSALKFLIALLDPKVLSPQYLNQTLAKTKSAGTVVFAGECKGLFRRLGFGFLSAALLRVGGGMEREAK